MALNAQTVEQVRDLGKYKYGFETEIEMETAPKGLSEDTVRFISAKKGEPDWMLDWRLRAYRHWQTMKTPEWANVHYPPIDYQDAYYYAAPKRDDERPKSLDEVDPKLLETYSKLGIPLEEQKILAGVAVDAVFDSVSVATTYKKQLEDQGIVFCAISEALQNHPELVRKYIGTVVPYTDNFYATLNSAVFSDGSFVYIPKGVRCPMELSTYFRINARDTGQFERTLIIADEGSYVSYLEGCTAPQRDEHQLHAAVVELIALDDAEIKYSTVQNWYPGDENGRGGATRKIGTLPRVHSNATEAFPFRRIAIPSHREASAARIRAARLAVAASAIGARLARRSELLLTEQKPSALVRAIRMVDVALPIGRTPEQSELVRATALRQPMPARCIAANQLVAAGIAPCLTDHVGFVWVGEAPDRISTRSSASGITGRTAVARVAA